MNYFNKTIQNINLPEAEYDSITYEISEEDLNRLSETWQTDLSLEDRHYLLEKDNIVDMLTDSISGDHIVIAGKNLEGKPVIIQYIVKRGLDKFHQIIGTL